MMNHHIAPAMVELRHQDLHSEAEGRRLARAARAGRRAARANRDTSLHEAAASVERRQWRLWRLRRPTPVVAAPVVAAPVVAAPVVAAPVVVAPAVAPTTGI